MFLLIVGILFIVILYFFIKEIFILFGVIDKLLLYCIIYGKVMILCILFYILKFIFEYFVRIDGNFKFSLFLLVIGGVINIILDYVFIKYFGMGFLGVVVVIVIGIILICVLGIIYFLFNKFILKLRKLKIDFRFIRDIMINGFFEMVIELFIGIIIFLFNVVVLKLVGENGFVVFIIVLYVYFLMILVYLGFVVGVFLLISYNFGVENSDKLKEIFKYFLKFIFVFFFLVFIIVLVFVLFIVRVFVSLDNIVFKLVL